MEGWCLDLLKHKAVKESELSVKMIILLFSC